MLNPIKRQAFTFVDEPAWPESNGRRIVFLIDASSKLERQLAEGWVERHRPPGSNGSVCEVVFLPPSRRPRRRPRLDPQLEAALAADDDPLLAPLRVVWRAPSRNGVRAARLYDLLTLGDPRDPDPLRQFLILGRDPERCRLVVGEPAHLSELHARWVGLCGSSADQTMGLAEYVSLQAALALERAERRLRGARYKVPRLVGQDILARPAFRAGVARLARETNLPSDRALKRAAAYLREIAAAHSPFVIDIVAQLTHLLYSRAYGDTLHYDHGQLERIYGLTQRNPVVFLPSHKSNLDHLVLQYALHENGLPPNHTAGGINMNFFPVGPLVRRSGLFFIRRSFKDNPLYKFVLKQYVDYLIEKRFSLEWYIEGGRSRSGKLMPPRFGLLAYVVDAYRRAKSDDVFLVPVSIAYDQIQDVGDYVAEQRGAAKERESFGWFLKVVRKLRRNYGGIHLRFADPLPLSQFVHHADTQADAETEETSVALQKIAFEVSVRINQVTPITPTSLVTLALLGTGDQAVTIGELVTSLSNLVEYVQRRNLPTTGPLDLTDPAGVQRTVSFLVEGGVVYEFSEGTEAVYGIGPGQHLAAAYYRNTIIHFFVNGALSELALLAAAEAADPTAAFWDAVLALRDLLKFEFFFTDKATFRQEIEVEVALHDPQWVEHLAEGPAGGKAVVRRFRPLSSHRILRPFLESYRVVGDALEQLGPGQRIDEGPFLARCLALGKQYHLQRRIRSEESVSKVLFETALKLARNRGLTEPDGAELTPRRQAFAEEIRSAIRRIDAVDAIVAGRRVGLID